MLGQSLQADKRVFATKVASSLLAFFDSDGASTFSQIGLNLQGKVVY